LVIFIVGKGICVMARFPNEEIVSRIAFLMENGSDEQVSEAHARFILLQAANKADREYPSKIPLLPRIEALIWEWWHDMAAAENTPVQPVVSKKAEPAPEPDAKPAPSEGLASSTPEKKPVSFTIPEIQGFGDFRLNSGMGA
jgi:hypothetical protein